MQLESTLRQHVEYLYKIKDINKELEQFQASPNKDPKDLLLILSYCAHQRLWFPEIPHYIPQLSSPPSLHFYSALLACAASQSPLLAYDTALDTLRYIKASPIASDPDLHRTALWIQLANAISTKLDTKAGHELFLLLRAHRIEALTPLHTLLRLFSNTRSLLPGRELHEHLLETFEVLPDTTFNELLHLYIKCDMLPYAHKLFTERLSQDIPVTDVSWNSLLSGYINDFQGSIALFEQMKEYLVPDEYTLVILLNTCATCKELEFGKSVHEYIRLNVMGVNNMFINGALINMYACCGEVDTALELLNELVEDKVLVGADFWSIIAEGYCRLNQFDKALKIIGSSPFAPTETTFIVLYNALIREGLPDKENLEPLLARFQVHEKSVLVGASRMLYYMVMGRVKDAEDLFKNTPYTYVRYIAPHAWNVMLYGYIHNGLYQEAVKLFKKMKISYLRFTALTLELCMDLVEKCPSTFPVISSLIKNTVAVYEEGHHYFTPQILSFLIDCQVTDAASKVLKVLKIRGEKALPANCYLLEIQEKVFHPETLEEGLELMESTLDKNLFIPPSLISTIIGELQSPSIRLTGKIFKLILRFPEISTEMANQLLAKIVAFNDYVQCKQLYESMKEHQIEEHTHIYSGLISVFAAKGDIHLASTLFEKVPTVSKECFSELLKLCYQRKDEKFADTVIQKLNRDNLRNNYIYDHLMRYYFVVNRTSEVEKLFEEIHENKYPLHTIFGHLTHLTKIMFGDHKRTTTDALKLVSKFVNRGSLNDWRFFFVLCESHCCPREAFQLYEMIKDTHIFKKSAVVLIKTLAAFGRIDISEEVFRINVSGYYYNHSNTPFVEGIFYAYAIVGNKKALTIERNLVEKKEYREITLLAYRNTGQFVEGIERFKTMSNPYQCEALVAIDMLSKLRKFTEALQVRNKYFGKEHSHSLNLILKEIIKANDESSFHLILYYYRKATKNQPITTINYKKRVQHIITNQGLSLEQIREFKEMRKHLNHIGTPVFVLPHVDMLPLEELWHYSERHSEMISLFLGLEDAKREGYEDVYMKKSTDMCGLCHQEFEVLSKVYGKTFVVRDCFRVHIFKDGKCSCSEHTPSPSPFPSPSPSPFPSPSTSPFPSPSLSSAQQESNTNKSIPFEPSLQHTLPTPTPLNI